MARLTHASFFSGAGGMDIGLGRAGWQTVSFSEIAPYPSSVLAERWPQVPNLGDITQVTDVPFATLWSGGFPCQDLSIAGKRGGINASRSGLAWAFLDLVERHRPEAFILENVPGLLSSNAGRDFGRLLGEVGDLGYGWAYRVLDAQWFGVPQRRRRVFVLALDIERHPDPDSASEVLAVGTSCTRDHRSERAAWASSAGRVGRGAEIVGALPAGQHGFPDGVQEFMQGHFIESRLECAPPDAAGMRTANGMAGRLDDRNQSSYVKIIRSGARNSDGELPPEVWAERQVAPTLNGFDVGDVRATTLVADGGLVTSLSKSFGTGGPDAAHAQAGWLVQGTVGADDAMNPKGLDSARYVAIGNGVASPVAEWIGKRLAAYLSAVV